MAVLLEAQYLSWAKSAVAAANRKWAARDRNSSIPLMTTNGLHSWIYDAGLKGGWILPLPKGELRKWPISHEIGHAFDRNPERVKQAARSYWDYMIEQRRNPT